MLRIAKTASANSLWPHIYKQHARPMANALKKLFPKRGGEKRGHTYTHTHTNSFFSLFKRGVYLVGLFSDDDDDDDVPNCHHRYIFYTLCDMYTCISSSTLVARRINRSSAYFPSPPPPRYICSSSGNALCSALSTTLSRASRALSPQHRRRIYSSPKSARSIGIDRRSARRGRWDFFFVVMCLYVYPIIQQNSKNFNFL